MKTISGGLVLIGLFIAIGAVELWAQSAGVAIVATGAFLGEVAA